MFGVALTDYQYCKILGSQQVSTAIVCNTFDYTFPCHFPVSDNNTVHTRKLDDGQLTKC